MSKMTLGSLFDGSGGFPLAGTINVVTPVWASEIEPYPIAVTTARFPSMKHLGSITDINGGSIEPVDIITFGSPCQDLSIAGNQKGIENGARSSLFFQAIRIIKEMREATNGVYPNYAVWENVPGAFSSNKGNDFRLVLEALASISNPTVSIPMPEKWQRSGEIVGDGYSIAWRTLDAQFWGVPQRRKRIYLVADFGSERAGEVLFKPDSLLGYPAQSQGAGQGATADAAGSAGRSCVGNGCLNPWDCQSKRIFTPNAVWPTLPAMDCGGANNSAVVYPINLQVITRHKALGRGTGFGAGEAGDAAYTLQAGHEHGVVYALQANGIDRADTAGCNGAGWRENASYTLNTVDRHGVAYSVDCRNMCLNVELSGTLQAKENGGQSLNYVNPVAYSLTGYAKYTAKNPLLRESGGDQGGGSEALVLFSRQRSDELTENTVASCQSARQYKDNTDLVIVGANPPRKYIVRRLTPTECARLQGFPDNWGDVTVKGKPHSDSAEYKMWGNGIALPCAVFVLRSVANLETKIGPALAREPDEMNP